MFQNGVECMKMTLLRNLLHYAHLYKLLADWGIMTRGNYFCTQHRHSTREFRYGYE